MSLLRQKMAFLAQPNSGNGIMHTAKKSVFGSYGHAAQAKTDFLNAFIGQNAIQSVVEFGCGDGNQLSSAEYPRYVGLDVSKTAIGMCRRRFARTQRRVSSYTTANASPTAAGSLPPTWPSRWMWYTTHRRPDLRDLHGAPVHRRPAVCRSAFHQHGAGRRLAVHAPAGLYRPVEKAIVRGGSSLRLPGEPTSIWLGARTPWSTGALAVV